MADTNLNANSSVVPKMEESNYRDTPGNAEIERLVAKLDSMKNGKPEQLLMVTSALLGEGKSTVSTKIAISSARNRKGPTLIVDFDIRRPRLHRIFDTPRGEGVVDLLCGRLSLKNCVKETGIPNLLILTSGVLTDSPIEVLNSNRIAQLVKEIRSTYMNVIVDVPPVIPVSDPLLIGKLVDNVVFVVKAGYTSRVIAKRALDMLYDIGVTVDGLVLNNMHNVLPYYYDHRYYGYKYFENSEVVLD